MGSGHLPMPRFVLLLLLLAHRGAPDLAADRAALVSFRSAVGLYLPWNLTSPNSSPCSWLGVTCQAGRVTVLRLPGAGLIGRIPSPSLGNLTAIHTLSLRFNALTGPLPSDLSSLTQLRNLYLQGNSFSGPIPSFLFSSMMNLVRLNLASNRFSGNIPAEVNNLKRLGTLYLESNDLAGEIPDLDLPNLKQFNVSFNSRLNGSIPQNLRSMDAASFLNTSLCGAPLPPCPWEKIVAPSGEVSGDNNNNKRKKLSGGAIAGIAIASVIGFLILFALLICVCKKKDGSYKQNEGGARSVAVADVEMGKPASEVEIPLTDKRVNENNNAINDATAAAATAAAVESGRKKLVFFGAGLRVYDLEDLLRASAEVLGKGAFGTAYRAVLEAGTVVAVKRLKEVGISETEFRERIEVIGGMEHGNLVGLRGYYFSKDERLLVYDYMANGSLSSLLHGNRGSGRTPLNWETRSAVALSAAKGIEYIHSTSPTASHGNIKSSNILLDKTYEAKVSDHGLCTLTGPTPMPNRVAGYRAPEVTNTQKVSQKADVYSFGVVLLELLTGKAPAQAALNEEGVDLPRWVQSVVREEWTSEVFDLELLRYQNVEEDMVELLQLAIDCAAQYPDRRPSMSEVVHRIEEIRQSSLQPSDDKEELNT